MTKKINTELEIASNNIIASPDSNNKITNILSIFGSLKRDNLETFIKSLPNSILLERYLTKNIAFVNEILNISCDYKWTHKYLIKLLQEYLNTEDNIEKLHLIECLKYISKLNNDLINYMKIIFLINHRNEYPTKKEFLEKLPVIFTYEFKNTLDITDYINYLSDIGLIVNTADNRAVDYKEIKVRISYHIWCRYQICNEGRTLLQEEVEKLYQANKDFKLLADFIYINRLQRFDLSNIALTLCKYLYPY